jgi:hypothetical protein
MTKENADEHLRRVRRLCGALPNTTEKLSHGEPTFFVGKKVYVMFANNHHHDGQIAIWLPVPLGLQPMLVKSEPRKFFRAAVCPRTRLGWSKETKGVQTLAAIACPLPLQNDTSDSAKSGNSATEAFRDRQHRSAFYDLLDFPRRDTCQISRLSLQV